MYLGLAAVGGGERSPTTRMADLFFFSDSCGVLARWSIFLAWPTRSKTPRWSALAPECHPRAEAPSLAPSPNHGKCGRRVAGVIRPGGCGPEP